MAGPEAEAALHYPQVRSAPPAEFLASFAELLAALFASLVVNRPAHHDA